MNRLPSIRRWGVAALTGVTLFGGLSIVGAGVASAAAPTVAAALTTGATATTIAGTATGAAGGSISIAVTGTPATGDQITLTLACPTTGTAVFATAPNSGSTDFSPTATIGTNSSGCSTATYTELAAVANPTLTIVPTFTTSGVTTQALSISGSYGTFGASTAFTVPTDASTLWYSASTNSPAVVLGGSATTAISPITISEPANLPSGAITGGNITVTLPTGDTWSGSPTVSAVPTGTTAPTVSYTTNVLTIVVGSVPAAGISASWTVNGASVTTSNSSNLGAQKVGIASTAPVQTLLTGVSVGSILGNVTTIFGQDGTADGTVAQEFENAFPANASNQTGGNANVVLATDAPSANGSDALAASYLEGTLHTGLLITSPTTLGADAQAAMKVEGVQTVYVVGGSLAISPAVIAEIEALPAYNPGGLTTTGSNVKVVGPIAGADGTAEGTAAKIATYFSNYGSASVAGAYSTSGGVYNDTKGSETAAPAAGQIPTAIVVAGTDWQDAMSIAPEAFNLRLPVILNGPSTDTTLDADASGALTALGVKQVIIVGGQLAVQNSVEAQIAALNGGISVLRIAGVDATDTAAQIANFALATTTGGVGLGWSANDKGAVLASHADYWSDALGAAALGGGANAGTYGTEPIILVESPSVVGTYTTSELAKLAAAPGNVTGLTVLGGPLAMPNSTVTTLLQGL